MSAPSQGKPLPAISVRPMREGDVPHASAISRLAFGTFLGVPEPSRFWPDREYVRTRWHTDPSGALVAQVEGRLAGSNFATNWGSFGFFGPLTIHPELWNKRVAQTLLGPTMELFRQWGMRDAGLFTFPHSTGHVHLYQKFDFWPRFLTAVMSKEVESGRRSTYATFSELTADQRADALKACRSMANSILEGLDLTREIEGVERQKLGSTLLLWGGDTLDGFAVCHCGENTEAGKDTCYVKFAAVRSGPHAEKTFQHLLDACVAMAAGRGLTRLEAGVNLARTNAYRAMLGRGFRTQMQGLAMHKGNSPAYNRPEVYAIDDWR